VFVFGFGVHAIVGFSGWGVVDWGVLVVEVFLTEFVHFFVYVVMNYKVKFLIMLY
jgi:hypothetical protein